MPNARSSVNPDDHAKLLLASIVESSDDAIISKDWNGTITSWNKSAERIFGYTADEVIGGPISVIIPPERGQEEIEILKHIRRGERIEHFETVRMRKDGTRIDVSVTISPLVHNGQIIGASKIARDISEQKRVREQLREQQSRLEVTLASIADGVIVTDVQGAVTFMNPVAETLTGWKVAEARGQAIEAVFNIVNEATRRRVENPVARALQHGAIVGLANHTVLLSRDQSEYAIDDSAAPIRSGDSVVGGVLVFRDVSGPRAAQTFRAYLAAIVESSEDAIMSKDLTGRITSWNAAAVRLFGYTPEEAIGSPISILIPPERLQEESHILDRLRRGERIEHLETFRVTKDHRTLQVALTISPIFNAEGEVVGASNITRDITQQKQLERELAEARERLQQHLAGLETVVSERTAELTLAYNELETFSYAVAHDLRAPLRTLNGNAQLLREELGAALAEPQQHYLRSISSSAVRMSQMLEDLLKLSRLGKQELRFEPASFQNLLDNALAELRPKTQNRQIDWQIDPLPPIRCDPGLMQQALVNLLENALKYTRQCSVAQIQIGRTSPAGEVIFHVRDNGVGFSMDSAELLFRPFHRLHPDRQFEGTGIGLAIVDRIIRKHGGRIWAESRPGAGATFYFTLGQKPA